MIVTLLSVSYTMYPTASRGFTFRVDLLYIFTSLMFVVVVVVWSDYVGAADPGLFPLPRRGHIQHQGVRVEWQAPVTA